MSDRYLYKAKRTDNREWVEGNYCKRKTGYFDNTGFHEEYKDCIITEFSSGGIVWCYIDPSTICQCTGFEDKNGRQIWENDIVSFEDTGEEGYEYKEGFDFTNRAKVEFAEGRWSLTDFASENSAVMDEMYDHAEFMELWQGCKVIGNIFDNPELLEVGAE